MPKRKWYTYHVKACLCDLLALADMFRYDSVHIEQRPEPGQTEAIVFSPDAPTVARWKSFDAQASQVQRCAAPNRPLWTVKRIPPYTGQLTWVQEQP